MAYEEIGKLGKAIADFTAIIRLNPEDQVAFFKRGLIYADLGQTAKAAKDFDEAGKLGHLADSESIMQ